MHEDGEAADEGGRTHSRAFGFNVLVENVSLFQKQKKTNVTLNVGLNAFVLPL